jgi:hypothetical protein
MSGEALHNTRSTRANPNLGATNSNPDIEDDMARPVPLQAAPPRIHAPHHIQMITKIGLLPQKLDNIDYTLIDLDLDDPASATTIELNTFALSQLIRYYDENLVDELAKEEFERDFSNWDKNMFARCQLKRDIKKVMTKLGLNLNSRAHDHIALEKLAKRQTDDNILVWSDKDIINTLKRDLTFHPRSEVASRAAAITQTPTTVTITHKARARQMNTGRDMCW